MKREWLTLGPLEWLASKFSLQYHSWIKREGDGSNRNDHLFRKLLFYHSLFVNTSAIVKRLVWRIWRLMLGCKGLRTKKTSADCKLDAQVITQLLVDMCKILPTRFIEIQLWHCSISTVLSKWKVMFVVAVYNSKFLFIFFSYREKPVHHISCHSMEGSPEWVTVVLNISNQENFQFDILKRKKEIAEVHQKNLKWSNFYLSFESYPCVP